jgi:PAS domain-containing protein
MTPAAAAPWLSAAAIGIAQQILHSHRAAFGTPLIAPLPADASSEQWAQALFAAERVVLAHDGADPAGDPGPRLIYANRAALRLWRRPWSELVGMPSRLTAEPAARQERSQALVRAQSQQAITGYGGVRIDSQGRRFRIEGARVFSLRDSAGEPCGQAACFSRWHWI